MRPITLPQRICGFALLLAGLTIIGLVARPVANDNPLPPIFAAGQSVQGPVWRIKGELTFCREIQAVHGTWVQWKDDGRWDNVAQSEETWVGCK